MSKDVTLLLVLMTAVGLPAAAQAPPSPSADAALEFALAKIALGEGDVPTAIRRFERAVELAPDDPYVRLEHAQLLARLAQGQRSPRAREQHLELAARQADEALRLAPENLDVLPVVGEIYLSLADFQPTAATVAATALEKVRARRPWDFQTMVSLGQFYRVRGEAAKAAEVFTEAVRHIPHNRLLLNFLAEAREEAGQRAAAEEVLAELVALDPNDLDSRVRWADAKSRRGDHPGAVAVLEAAPEESRGDPRLGALLVRELYFDGQRERALALAEQILAQDPGDRFRLFLGNLRAAMLVELGRNEEAYDQYRALLALDPGNADLVQDAARQMARGGRRSEAIELLSGFLARTENSARQGAKEGKGAVEGRGGQAAGGASGGQDSAPHALRLTLAALYGEDEDWEHAAATLRPLLAVPDREVALPATMALAEALYRGGKEVEALRLLEEEHGRWPVVVGKRTELLLRSGSSKEARKLLHDTGLHDELEAAIAAVQAFHSQDRYAETLPLLEKLAEKHHQVVEPVFLLGAAFERSGETTRAATAFEQALAVDPDHAPTLNYLGYMWADRGERLDHALALVERAVSLEPNNGAYVDSLGWVLYRLGRFGEAREHLERAARLVPGDPVIFEHLGDVYVALGDRQKAADSYRRALDRADEGSDLDPHEVRRKLDRLGDR